MKAKAQITYSDGKIYPAVSLVGLKDEMWPVIPVVAEVYKEYNIEAVLTAGTECFRLDVHNCCVSFIHALNSLHPQGYALDFSTSGIEDFTVIEITQKIQDRLNQLGEGYEVIWESKKSHIHIEFDKKIITET